MSYNSRCHYLAEHFLSDKYRNRPDYANLADEQAQRIQDAIEDYLSDLEAGH
jgi:hypothetical protein